MLPQKLTKLVGVVTTLMDNKPYRYQEFITTIYLLEQHHTFFTLWNDIHCFATVNLNKSESQYFICFPCVIFTMIQMFWWLSEISKMLIDSNCFWKEHSLHECYNICQEWDEKLRDSVFGFRYNCDTSILQWWHVYEDVLPCFDWRQFRCKHLATKITWAQTNKLHNLKWTLI